MVSHPAVWLVKYALWCCMLSVVPQLVICVRAFFVFPECRICGAYMWDVRRIREVGAFGMWNLMGTICSLLREQGTNVVVNKAFGARVNAAMALGSSVNAHSSALTSSLLGAMAPAVTTAYGAGQTERMQDLAYRMCKFVCALLLIFFIPLISELQTVLVLWLKEPPQYTTYLCFVMLLMNFLEVSTNGHMVAVNASGHVKEYQLNMTMISILTLPAVIATVWLGGGIYALGIVLICVRISISLRRVYYARIFAGLSAKYWIHQVVVPILIVVLVSGGVSLLPRLMFEAGFIRIAVTTFISEVVLLPLLWFVLLSNEERRFVVEKFGPRLRRLLGRG